jgi:hypothetical protein
VAEGLIFNLNDASKPLRQLRAPAPSGGITNGDSDGLLLPNQNDQPLTSGDAGVEKVNEQRRKRRGQSTTGQINSTAFQSLRASLCLSRVDPRQRGLFNAAWTLAYIAALARGGVEAIALGAPTGPFGCIYRRMDFVQPYFDELAGSCVYPVFHVLAGLHRSRAGRLATEVSPKGAIDALAVRTSNATVLWIANKTGTPRNVLPPARAGGRITDVDAAGFDQLTTTPLFLFGESESRRRSDRARRLRCSGDPIPRLRPISRSNRGSSSVCLCARDRAFRHYFNKVRPVRWRSRGH